MSLVEEISAADLLDAAPTPYVRWELADDPVTRGWRYGDALVVEVDRTQQGSHPRPGTTWVATGPAPSLAPLLAGLARVETAPDRLSLEDVGVTPPWPQEVLGRWTWMWSDLRPPAPAVPVIEVTDDTAIDALLDAGNPTSWDRPANRTAEAWLGVEQQGRLVAVGSITRRGSGVGHLQGVTVHPDLRGRRLGVAVSAALTARAQASGPGVATLGVYTANTPAVRTYERLGYRAPHRFLSGPVRPATGS